MDETIRWRSVVFHHLERELPLNVAVLGMAVAGDIRQLVIADELHQVKAVVVMIRDEEGVHFQWINPPSKDWKGDMEKTFEEFYPAGEG